MSTKFSLDLNGTIVLRTDKVFRNAETKSTEHTLAFDHVCLAFDNVDQVAEAFTAAVATAMSSMPSGLWMPVSVKEHTFSGTYKYPADGAPLDLEAHNHIEALLKAKDLWVQYHAAATMDDEARITREIEAVLGAAGLAYQTTEKIERILRHIELEGCVPGSARLIVDEAKPAF